MLNLPWTQGPAGRDRSASERTVMASRLELRSHWRVPAFLIAALQLRRAIRHADGAIGLGLRYQPLNKTFWTLSAWTSSEALQGFNHTALHRWIVDRFRPHITGSTFRFYTDSLDAAPDWDEAIRRIGADENLAEPEDG